MNNKPLELTKINQLEELYSHITDSNCLYLSPNIKFKHLGGNWDIIQFICTWQKQHKETSILLDKQVNIDTLSDTDEILLITFFIADKVIYKNKDIKRVLLKKFTPLVKKMNSFNISKKNPLICLGGAKNEFLKVFYSKDERPQSRGNITLMLKSLFWLHADFEPPNLTDILNIMYELTDNTHEHARHDTLEKKIPKSIRALSVDYIEFNKNDKGKFLVQQSQYSEFLSNKNKIFVISIFDNGEGIIKKYIETGSNKKLQNMTLSEKEQSLKDVFNKNISSSTEDNAGMGLYYVEESIKKLGGLLSIKTNALSLFMSPNKYEKTIGSGNVYGGTLITALIPLDLVKK